MANPAENQKPYVENYPPLHAWLKRHHAACVWQIPGPSKSSFVECWTFPGGRHVILQVHDRGHGWEIFTEVDEIGIDGSLALAEKALNL